MAVTVVALLTELSDADTTTGWSGNSGGQDLYSYIEGGATPASYTWYLPKNSNQTCTFTPATNQNFTTNYTYPHLYFWFQTSVAQFLQVRASSGFRVRLTDGSGNWTEWYMAGSDTWRGEWKCFILDCNNTSDVQASSGTLSLTDIDIVSFYVDSINVGYRNVDNMWNDLLQFGEGLQSYGTSYDLTDIADVDATEANQYGILQARDGVLFCQGRLEIGDGTNQTTYSSSGEVLFFLDPTTGGYNGGAVGSVNSNLYVFFADGNSSNSTFSHTGGVISASGNATYHLDLDATSFQTITFTGNTVSKANAVDFWASSTSCTVTGNTFDTCGPISPKGSKFENNTINNTTAATSTGAVYITDSTTVTNMKNLAFNGYTNKYAVYIPASVTGSITFDNWIFDGVNGTGADVYWAGTAGTLTISKNNGSNPSTSATAGGTVSFVGASVDTKVIVVDSTGSAVTGAEVFLRANSEETSGLPYDDTVTIVNSGTTATVTHTAHGMLTGDKVYISGASHYQNNGGFTITLVNANSYTYTMSSAPGSSPTGTIKANYLYLFGTANTGTNSNELTLSKVLPTNQDVIGWARKSSTSPYYKQAPISGQVTSAGGGTFTAVLTLDE
jgi:hypothetical protein